MSVTINAAQRKALVGLTRPWAADVVQVESVPGGDLLVRRERDGRAWAIGDGGATTVIASACPPGALRGAYDLHLLSALANHPIPHRTQGEVVKLREPIPVQPFLTWLDERADRQAAEQERDDVNAVALQIIGWDTDAGARRLHRWRHELASDRVERGAVEDALEHADVAFWELYPEHDDAPAPGRRDRGRSYVCDEEVLIRGHAMHMDGMSVRGVARELFEECFSASPKALANALLGAWRGRGWEVRGQSAATAAANAQRAWRPRCSHVHQIGPSRGQRCTRQCVGNDQTCWKHDPARIASGTARAQQRSAA